TIPCVLFDIATPPMGGLNLFNLYIALSRMAHSPELLAEDDHLQHLDWQTRGWWQEMMMKTLDDQMMH
ncbi:hypothetical protein M404DRAFT_120963, partial [Pisolithus tinctorius Marx 270]